MFNEIRMRNNIWTPFEHRSNAIQTMFKRHSNVLAHGNSVSSVACDLLYKTTNLFFSLTLWFNFLFSTEDTEVTDYFSVFCVLRGLILLNFRKLFYTTEIKRYRVFILMKEDECQGI